VSVQVALASCHELSVTYGTGDSLVTALDQVTLEIEGGERVALLGRSGSGKTTLLHAFGGLVEPTSGTVQWNGRRLASLDQSARSAVRAHGIAYVFQGANLLPHFTALENIAFAAATDARLSPLDVLELVGLTAKAGHLPAHLSGGEAQRVGIARALAQAPDLLLCDEPTGHLDSDTGERLLDLIDALQRELGFALVIATHDPVVGSRLNREVELEDGTVVREERA
jgi:putative ABC transport system ATP-binding protein